MTAKDTAKRNKEREATTALGLILRDLIRRGLKGDLNAAQEFQQMIQYAPLSMREQMGDYIGIVIDEGA